MVLAYRPEETDSGHPLEMLVDDVARTNEVIRIQLGGLDQSALATLTTDDTLAAAIVGGTDRSPLAGVRSAHGPGDGGADQPRWPDVAPHRSWCPRRTRRDRCGWTTTDDLAACQPAARPATGPAGLPRACGEADRSRVVGSCAGPRPDLGSCRPRSSPCRRAGAFRRKGWHTAHDLIAATVIDGLEPGHRAELHRRLAHALTLQDGDPAELARHLAGAGNLSRAATAYARAAQGRLDAREQGSTRTGRCRTVLPAGPHQPGSAPRTASGSTRPHRRPDRSQTGPEGSHRRPARRPRPVHARSRDWRCWNPAPMTSTTPRSWPPAR